MVEKKYQELSIETNIFKIIWKIKHHLLRSKLLVIWLLIFITLLILNYTSNFTNLFSIKSINISNFLSYGITALSFTLAVLSAALRIFNDTEFTQLYLQKNDKYKNYGELYYLTLAPYIVTPTLWLIISLISLVSSVLSINVPPTVSIVFKLLFISLVAIGLISSWNLFIIHIQDFSKKIQRRINDVVRNIDKPSTKK